MNDATLDETDLIWGADNIGRILGLSQRQTFYRLEAGQLPAKKLGRTWVTKRSALKRFIDQQMS